MMRANSKLGDFQNRHRFFFIELLLWWQGTIQNRDLQGQFGISRQQALENLTAYCEGYPDNLFRKNKRAPYQVSENFKAHFINQKIAQYWHWLRYKTLCSEENSHSAKGLNLPVREVKAEIIRGLSQAIFQKLRIEVDYRSITNPDRQGRIFHPHTFVYTGQRWHIRGYCEKNKDYQDFVVSRFHEVELLDNSEYGLLDDTLWNTEIEVILKPDPRLSDEKKAVLIHDYNMENGLLKIKVSAALVTYLLFELKISTKSVASTPEAQQLIIVNFEDIKSHIFES